MGRHTWFEACDAQDEEALREERWEVDALRTDGRLPQPLAMHGTGRLWHAIHVGLTGLDDAPGDPPASLVVWRGEHLEDDFAHETHAMHVHSVETVRKVAAYLGSVPTEVIERRLRAALEAGVWVYSFDREFGPEAQATLRAGYEELVGFYQQAAERGWILRVTRL